MLEYLANIDLPYVPVLQRRAHRYDWKGFDAITTNYYVSNNKLYECYRGLDDGTVIELSVPVVAVIMDYSILVLSNEGLIYNLYDDPISPRGDLLTNFRRFEQD